MKKPSSPGVKGPRSTGAGATPPLPEDLAHWGNEATRPLHCGSGDVARLLEHWGYTRNGREFVKKLRLSGALPEVKLKHVQKARYETATVLALWGKE